MEINSIEDLEKIERKIHLIIRKFRLGDILASIRDVSEKLEPFIIAGIALFACRYCTPSKTSQTIKKINLDYLIHLITQYLLADPITFDKNLHEDFIESNPIFLLLRVTSSQFPYHVNRFGQYAQPMFLFPEIPNQLKGQPNAPQFDFDSSFQKLSGVSLTDFISVGFVASAAAHINFAFNQDYFRKARNQGINIPQGNDLRQVLNQLAVDKSKLTSLYEKYKTSDRRFRMYDFNPLFLYPIIRPCQGKQFATPGQDYMTAPLPALIDLRISTGVFYQMFNHYGEKFSQFFGYIFKIYIGIILKNSISSETIFSETDMRQFYSTQKGKVPDWVIVDGCTAILVECKATRFSRAAQAIASESEVNKSLAQVKKGLKQLNEFISACQLKPPELHPFHGCNVLKPVLLTLEPLHLINSTFFREHINQLLLAEGVQKFPWQILSVGELEVLQPHLAAGIKLAQVLEDLSQKRFNEVLEELCSLTNRSYKDSFLYPKQEELYQRLVF